LAACLPENLEHGVRLVHITGHRAKEVGELLFVAERRRGAEVADLRHPEQLEQGGHLDGHRAALAAHDGHDPLQVRLAVDRTAAVLAIVLRLATRVVRVVVRDETCTHQKNMYHNLFLFNLYKVLQQKINMCRPNFYFL